MPEYFTLTKLHHPMDPEELVNNPLSEILEFAEKSPRFCRSKEVGQTP